jgi:hypothetical protein
VSGLKNAVQSAFADAAASGGQLQAEHADEGYGQNAQAS